MNIPRLDLRAIGYLVGLGFVILPGVASAQAGTRPAVPTAFAAPWHTVFTGPDLAIGLDTSRVERVDGSTYRVWMQTRWAAPRYGSRKRTPLPFNREMIRTYLRCDPIAYKVVGTVVSLDDGPPVDSVIVGEKAASAGNWKDAEPGSADAGAGKGACAILDARARRR